MRDEPDATHYTVWVTTEFRVAARAPEEAVEQVRKWLTETLEIVTPSDDGIEVLCSAARISDVALLALQLAALEARGGKATALIAKLRAELEAT